MRIDAEQRIDGDSLLIERPPSKWWARAIATLFAVGILTFMWLILGALVSERLSQEIGNAVDVFVGMLVAFFRGR